MRDDFEDALEMARALLGENEGTGDVWEANEHVNEALAMRPRAGEAWLLKCQIQSALDDEPAALASVEMALRCGSRTTEAHYWRAVVRANMERDAEALKALERAFRYLCDGDEWLVEDLYYEKGAILDAIGRDDEALATYEAGLSRFPESQILRAGMEPIRRERTRRAFTVLPGGRP
mgnify:FL=1